MGTGDREITVLDRPRGHDFGKTVSCDRLYERPREKLEGGYKVGCPLKIKHGH